MQEFKATVTKRNQVTIPGEIRRRLGIKPGYTVSFRCDETGGVQLVVAAMTLEDAYGSVSLVDGATVVDDDYKSAIREAKEEKAERTLRKMGLL